MHIAIIEAANVEVPIAFIVIVTVVVVTAAENNDKKDLSIRLSTVVFIQTKSNKHLTFVCIHVFFQGWWIS